MQLINESDEMTIKKQLAISFRGKCKLQIVENLLRHQGTKFERGIFTIWSLKILMSLNGQRKIILKKWLIGLNVMTLPLLNTMDICTLPRA